MENPHILESLVNLAAIRIAFHQLDRAKAFLNRAQVLSKRQRLARSNPHRLKLEHWERVLNQAKRGD